MVMVMGVAVDCVVVVLDQQMMVMVMVMSGAGGKSFSNKDALEADEGKVNCLEQDRRGKRICNAPTLPSWWGDDESGDAKNLNGDDDGD